MIYSTVIPSPVGDLTLFGGEAGLRAVLWHGERADRAALGDDTTPATPDTMPPVLQQAATQLNEYFAGDRQVFDLPLDPVGTPFQLQAWLALRSIAYGETISYGEQARRLGDPNKARAVGAANGRNPLSIIVPCHRVVGSNGKLTGFAGGLDAKAWLLQHEFEVAASASLSPAG
jgi:methylated-DNA-[protein]-cysteine S-methyltransferase